MWEPFAIVMIAAGAWFWVDSLRARERALAVGRRACERYGVQLLDETVAFATLGIARDDAGRLHLRRSYTFEFSDTGNNRRRGAMVMRGGDLQPMRREPYKLQ